MLSQPWCAPIRDAPRWAGSWEIRACPVPACAVASAANLSWRLQTARQEALLFLPLPPQYLDCFFATSCGRGLAEICPSFRAPLATTSQAKGTLSAAGRQAGVMQDPSYILCVLSPSIPQSLGLSSVIPGLSSQGSSPCGCLQRPLLGTLERRNVTSCTRLVIPPALMS